MDSSRDKASKQAFKQDHVIEMEALGRPFQLGMLYNLSDETLISGFTLWSHSQIQKNKRVTPKNSTEFYATGSESIEDKAMSLNLGLQAQLSMFLGLIKAKGSAKYFTDTKKLYQHAQLTLKYHTTTRFEQLTMDHLAIRGDLQTTELKATHVVVAVLYGAKAFFTFDRKLTKEESEEQLTAEMQLAIPRLTFSGSHKKGHNEHKQFHNISCSFNGDFKLDKIPSTFKDAVQVYTTLPSMLGENGENAVPLRVWLYPLSRLVPSLGQRVIDISTTSLTQILRTLEGFDMIELKCNHLVNNKAAQTFPVIQDNIIDFQQKCLNYKKDLMETLRVLLPLVRNGAKQEKDIANLLERHETSQFKISNLNQWLNLREKELQAVEAILNQLQDAGADLEERTAFSLLDKDIKNVVCFTFTSLDWPDPFPCQLSDYPTWLTEDTKLRMRNKLQLFCKLKRSTRSKKYKFVVSSKHHKEHPGACIMLYGEECFTPPSKPICSNTGAVTESSVTVKLSPACEASVKRKLEYKMKQEKNWMCEPLYQEEINLSNLKPESTYEIKCIEEGKLGYSATSDVITIQTLRLPVTVNGKQPTKVKDSIPTKDHRKKDKAEHPTHFKGQSVMKNDTAMQTECDSPSHVVTAVWYGADAYFTSEEGTSRNRKGQISQGELKLIKTLSLGTSLNETEGESATSMTEKFSCVFSGDFKLPASTTSITDAFNLCIKPSDTQKEENALYVWFYPLSKLESNVAKLDRDIHSILISDISDVIHSLNRVERRCKDMENDTVVQTFSGFCTKIQLFKKECSRYKLGMMRKLGSLLPSICQGEKENVLPEFLIMHEESPFNTTKLDKWLKTKEDESSVIKIFLQELQAIGVDNDHVSDPEADVVSFTFTSLDEPDEFLSQLSEYVRSAAVKKDTSTESQKSETQNSEIQTWLTEDVKQRMRQKLQLFKNLKMFINCDSTKFIVTSKLHNLHPGACVMVFKGGASEGVCFTPPSKPLCSITGAVTDTSVTVKVRPECEASVKRNLEYKMNQEEWKCRPLEKDEEEVTLTELNADTVYLIKCTAVGQLEYTVASDIITIQTLEELQRPIDLRVINKTSSSVQLCWCCPLLNSGRLVNGYIVEYKKEDGSQWLSRYTSAEHCVLSLGSLTHDTSYVVRISTDCGESGVSNPSEELLVTTKRDWVRLMEDAHESCSILSDGPPSVYTLNLKRVVSGQWSKYSFGVPSPLQVENRTIMLLGATGSGKTTLINGMINYILGVDWEDDCRFKLMNEITSKTQVESKTEEVTAYHIHHMKGFEIPYSLTIIDTPGFGYTSGMLQNQALTEQIQSFMCQEDDFVSVDAVCFVIQSSLPHLTRAQKHIFQSILSLFGKDMKNNIVILVTFADAETPPALEALKTADICSAKQKDGSPLHFKFNNSVLFAPNEELVVGDQFGKLFWDMGKESMGRFFKHLNSLQTHSLQLTKEVLEEHRHLQLSIKELQLMIQTGLRQVDVIEQTRAAVEQQQSIIDANRHFEYEVEISKAVQVDISGNNESTTNCLSCNYTCHYPCGIANNEEKINCNAMSDGYCTVCPGKCAWIVHFNLTYIWDTETVREKRTYDNLKHQYEAAVREKATKLKLKAEHEAEHDALQGQVLSMVGEITRCLRCLNEIALHPDPLSTPDYIDLLIQSEEQEAKPGFQKRITELQHVREYAVILQKDEKEN